MTVFQEDDSKSQFCGMTVDEHLEMIRRHFRWKILLRCCIVPMVTLYFCGTLIDSKRGSLVELEKVSVHTGLLCDVW
jgi:hypothetical protein